MRGSSHFRFKESARYEGVEVGIEGIKESPNNLTILIVLHHCDGNGCIEVRDHRSPRSASRISNGDSFDAPCCGTMS